MKLKVRYFIQGFSCVVAGIILFFITSFIPSTQLKTSDDSKLLRSYIINNRNNIPRVLGVNGDEINMNECPKDKPITGWLDYNGEKILTTDIPNNEPPTICFRTMEEAYDSGFVAQ